jgi:5-methylcytosine-specific restriction protein A
VPKQPCGNRLDGCRNLVNYGTRYCDGCLANGAGKDKRPSSTQRGYGYKWQKASAAYLLAHPIAVDWFREHGDRILPAEVVDHIVPHRGDMKLLWDPYNWQGLTKADHDRKTALEDGGFGNARRSK